MDSNIKVLMCRYAYYFKCFVNILDSNCNYCFHYYKTSIEELSNSFNFRLTIEENNYENNEIDKIDDTIINIEEINNDEIFDNINLNENDFDIKLTTAINNFNLLINEDLSLSNFRRLSIDFSENINQNDNEILYTSNKRKRNSYFTNPIKKK